MDKSMCVLVAGSAWPPETFIDRLLRGLLSRGFRITVASAKRPAPDWLAIPGFIWLPTSRWEGNSLLRIMWMIRKFTSGFLRSRKDIKSLAVSINTIPDYAERMRLWDRLSPYAGSYWDVIYFPWNSAAIEYLPIFDLGIPVVISCRGSQVNVAPHNPRRAEIQRGLPATFARAAAVHCVSHDILRQSQPLGLDLAKAYVIHPAVDSDYFCPAEFSRQPDSLFRIITTGSLIWVKGFEYALLAIRLLKDAGVPVSFEIIGDGVERSRVLFTIDDLGLRDCVHLAGRLPPDQVRSRLKQADVFVLSSLSEGISNAVLEAMACGLPVVTTDCGGMREAVTDGVEGFVTPVRDPESMASALRKLWCDPTLRQQMGEAGRRKIVRDFNVMAQLEQWMELYRGLQPIHNEYRLREVVQ